MKGAYVGQSSDIKQRNLCARPAKEPFIIKVWPNTENGSTNVRIQMVTLNVSDAPPSYDAIFGEVQRAKQESSGVLEFFKKLVIIILGTCMFVCYVCLLFCIFLLNVFLLNNYIYCIL